MAFHEELEEFDVQLSPKRSTSNKMKMSSDNEERALTPAATFEPHSPNNRVGTHEVCISTPAMSALSFNKTSKVKLWTPAATPATESETPTSEDNSSAGSDSNGSMLSTPVHTSKSMALITNVAALNRSSTLPTDTPSTVSPSSCPELGLEPCTRDPPPQQEGRTLFHDYSRETFPVDTSTPSLYHSVPSLLHRGSVRLTQSVGPGVPKVCELLEDGNDTFNLSQNRNLHSNSSRSHILRSRRYQHDEGISLVSSSAKGDRRGKHSRRRSLERCRFSETNNSGFSTSVMSMEDEVSLSSTEDSTTDFNSSSRRIASNKNRRRQRSQTLSLNNVNESTGNTSISSENLAPNFGALFKMQRMASTKALVWLLCFVGMTSTAMIVMTNHNISKSFDFENVGYQGHVTVLFPQKQKRPANKRRVRVQSPDLRNDISVPSKDILPQANDLNNAGALPYRQNTLNLNKLSHFQEDQSLTAENEQDNAKASDNVSLQERDDKRKEDPQHRARSKHDKKTHGKTHRRGKTHHEKKKEHTHHHTPQHDGQDEQTVTEATLEESPVFIVPEDFGIAGIRFELVDRYLYSGGLSSLSGGSKHNRVVMFGDFHDQPASRREVQLFPSPFTDNTQVYPILDSADDSDERIRTMEIRKPHVEGECVPMADWQTTFHPSCNGMHELDLANVEGNQSEESFTLFGKNGFWRNAWKYENSIGQDESDTVVLKTLKINHRFEDAHFEHNRIDAVVLERLTASKHVIDIFGFCGHSVLTEYADGKRLGDLADKKAKIPLARLKIAIDIASGLADVHGIDGDEHASFVHLDINPANVVSIGGTLKLNDFNIGVLRRLNTTSNTPCGIPAQYPNPQWRSPEEARNENTLTEKVDVFSMGHIFFRLICGREPWNKLEPGGMPPKAVLNEKVKNGELPTIPDYVMNSNDPEVIAIRDAMLECYRYDPVKRPSSRSIANKLRQTLAILEGSNGETLNKSIL